MTRYAFAGVFVVVSAVAGVLALQRAEPGSQRWVISPQERLALEGLQSRASLIDEAIAKVSSGDNTKAQYVFRIAQAYHELQVSNQGVLDEVRSRCHISEGVAFVISGSEWVTR